MKKAIFLMINSLLLCSSMTALASESELSATGKEIATLYPKGESIPSQTFSVRLQPLGQVTFGSYKPDVSQNPEADAVFLIEKDGKVIQELSGVTEDNCRSGLVFQNVDAVSFVDYNSDGYDDIVLILSYLSEKTGTKPSEIRYYTGNKDGIFTYEEQMSTDATSALTEHTIDLAKSFIGADNALPAKSWPQAYLDYLQFRFDCEDCAGFSLIYLDDDNIPELVDVGKYAASGCRIINYSNGTYHATQLDRLNFTYIEGENLLCNSDGAMDSYYDLVYSIIDGSMTMVANGRYGLPDSDENETDDKENLSYQYKWNGMLMSEDEYREALDAIYDSSKAISGYDYDELYSWDKMTSLLNDTYLD